MKIFLDECVDWRLSRELAGHETATARQMGWTSIENGELLALASQQFDVFVTVDRKSIVPAEPERAEDRCRRAASGDKQAGRSQAVGGETAGDHPFRSAGTATIVEAL